MVAWRPRPGSRSLGPAEGPGLSTSRDMSRCRSPPPRGQEQGPQRGRDREEGCVAPAPGCWPPGHRASLGPVSVQLESFPGGDRPCASPLLPEGNVFAQLQKTGSHAAARSRGLSAPDVRRSAKCHQRPSVPLQTAQCSSLSKLKNIPRSFQPTSDRGSSSRCPCTPRCGAAGSEGSSGSNVLSSDRYVS